MKLRQQAMIRMARSRRTSELVKRQAWMAGLAARFVGGSDAGAVAATARSPRADGISASLFYLGEYVEDPRIVEATVGQLRAAIDVLHAEGLDMHISVDPTQLGLMSSAAACEANVRQVAAAVARVCPPATRPGHDAVTLPIERSGTADCRFSASIHSARPPASGGCCSTPAARRECSRRPPSRDRSSGYCRPSPGESVIFHTCLPPITARQLSFPSVIRKTLAR